MEVTTSGIVLFLHVAAVVTGLMLAAVLHAALLMTRRAGSLTEYRAWVPVIGRVEPLLPVTALVILGTGGWLLHLSGGEASWSDGWVIVSLVTLVCVEAAGAAVGPRSKRWRDAIKAAPGDGVPDDVREAGRDPLLWYVAHANTAAFVGVLFVMSAKPSTAGSVLAVAVAALLGLMSAAPFLRRPASAALPQQRRVTAEQARK